MGYLKTEGIVIKEFNTGEADRIITIFTKNNGKLSAIARNSKKSGNRISSGTQLLCYSEFVLFKGKDLYNISSCGIIKSFHEIGNDLVKLTYVSHLLEIINDVVQENQNYYRVLRLFLNILHIMSTRENNAELMVRIFELRLMRYLGYTPTIKTCVKCGCEESDKFYFSFDACGIVCSNCATEGERISFVSEGCKKALVRIMYGKLEELFSFSLSDEVLKELGNVSSKYLNERLEKSYNKMEFLKLI